MNNDVIEPVLKILRKNSANPTFIPVIVVVKSLTNMAQIHNSKGEINIAVFRSVTTAIIWQKMKYFL